MTKYCVKKPFFVFVAVIIVLTLGGVSLSKMQTDMLPDLELPYMMVITTEPGASPEKVENDVTKPLESALGTVSGVNNVMSTSSENYGIVTLEFAEKTDMNAALVRVSKAVNGVELPEECGTPNTMEISADMMASMYATVDYKGKDIEELSKFTEKVVKPYLERQDGVASVNATGMVDNTIEVRLVQDKIDKINDKILEKTDSKLSDAQEKIDKAKSKLDESKSKLSEQKDNLSDKQEETNDKLAEANLKLTQAQATKVAYESSLNSLKASEGALKGELNAYKKAKIEETYNTLNQAFAKLNENLSAIAGPSGITVPESVEYAVNHKSELESFIEWMKKIGYEKEVKELTYKNLKKIYDIAEVRIPQINTELANLKTEIAAAEAMVSSINKKMKGIDEAYVKASSGGYSAAAGFGSASAQMSSGENQIKTAEKDLEDAQKKLDDSKKAARENSNLNALLTLDTLSGIITAQNFSMPAGYVDDKSDNQWLVKVGDNYDSIDDIKDMVLTKVSGIGDIKMSDVADITMINNADDSYAKVNGESAIMLSIFKSSTSSTSTVTDGLMDAFKKLEKENDGLSITPMMNQGDFISQIISSVLSSIIMGAILAIIVLALFLKDVRPTIVVAFSIPFSVLFAIIIMYFTGININVMSLAGLCLGIGMLVDNSVVVMENIYRLRGRGISAPRAAVQGAKQVAGPIIASTITTICVFFPMVYTSGMVSDLLIPFCFTISYALIASLIVALTVVPTMGSVLLKKVKKPKQKIFDAIKSVYAMVLSFCLRFKIVPLVIAVVLLIFSVYELSRTGMVMMDNMESNQIGVSLTLDSKTDRETAYATADKVTEAILKVKGVDKVGVMDGGATAMAAVGSSGNDNYTNFSFNILTKDDIKTTSQFKKIRKEIENNTKDIECEEISVSSSAMGGASSVFGGGMEVDIYGSDQQKLIEISKDVMKMIEDTKGCENISNGQEEGKKQVHINIDKNKAAEKGLTVAQIFQQLSGDIATDKKAVTLSIDDKDVDVNIVDETDKITYENILDTEITATTKNSKGEDVTKDYKLSDFASAKDEESISNITRENQTQFISVKADVKDGDNTALLSRKLQKFIDKYKAPEGYSIEIGGESDQVNEMVKQMTEAIALGFLLIYLVMVAQFQSLLSPFIILFTIPLAFTGGMIGLLIFGQQISAMALMGFMILMGTVVNNGIVFVDYVNKLRIQGVDKHTALIATGETRMRPIFMTALTTILSMSVMMFSKDAGNSMQKSMAIVVACGLIYSTLMTLFIVPVMYDILYRRQPHDIDVGDGDMDEIPDEASEFIDKMRLKEVE